MKYLVCFILTCLIITRSYADTVTLNNGDILTGTIIRKEDDKLVFKTTYAGELKILWDQISAIKTDKPVALTLKNDTSIENASILPATNKSARIKTDNIKNNIDIQLSSIKYINPSAAVSGKGIQITGWVNAGINIASGNSDTESYNMDTEIILRSKINRFTVGTKSYRAKSNNLDTEDKSSIWFKYDHFLDKKHYIYGNTYFANDKFKDQKLKSTIGLGYGKQIRDTSLQHLSFEGGLNYVNEDFYVSADDNYAAGRWAVKFDQFFYDKRLQFFHSHEGLIDFEDSDNLNIISQTGFRFPILSGINASLQLNLNWDKQPAAGASSTDRKILFNLGYNW